mmetsp:Transcript_30377/g.91978  ORF Transcript_30377/g.91978 Transcript_30377/m.91978 type:complete len:269 (+) Transcript_30377:1235-2041(+)
MTNFAYPSANAIRAKSQANVLTMPTAVGCDKLTWSAKTAIAQMSWQIRMPIVIRPAIESASDFCPKSLTTIIVEEKPAVTPQYRAAYWPGPKLTPAASSPTKMPAMMAEQSGSWTKPVRHATLPILKTNALTSSSRPIMNNRKIKPRCVISESATWLSTMLRTLGPTNTPPARYPRMSGCLTVWAAMAHRPDTTSVTATYLINGATPPPRRLTCAPWSAAWCPRSPSICAPSTSSCPLWHSPPTHSGAAPRCVAVATRTKMTKANAIE